MKLVPHPSSKSSYTLTPVEPSSLLPQLQGSTPARWAAELGLIWLPGSGLQAPHSQHQYREPGQAEVLWLTLLSPLPPGPLAALSALQPSVPEAPSTCYFWGGSHYRMFDGSVLSLSRPGCTHTLVSEPLAGSVTVEAEVVGPGALVLHLTLETEQFRLEGAGGRAVVTQGASSLAVPGRHGGVTLQQAGAWLLVEVQGLGLRLVWDTKDFLMITAEGPLWGRTAGLCGSASGNPYDDFSTADGSASSGVGSWVESWEAESEECGGGGGETHPCMPGSQTANQATAFCRKLLDRFDCTGS